MLFEGSCVSYPVGGPRLSQPKNRNRRKISGFLQMTNGEPRFVHKMFVYNLGAPLPLNQPSDGIPLAFVLEGPPNSIANTQPRWRTNSPKIANKHCIMNKQAFSNHKVQNRKFCLQVSPKNRQKIAEKIGVKIRSGPTIATQDRAGQTHLPFPGRNLQIQEKNECFVNLVVLDMVLCCALQPLL